MNKIFSTIIVGIMLTVATVASAQNSKVGFSYAPDCEVEITKDEDTKNDIFGNDKIGNIEGMINPGNEHADFTCTFPVKNPGTMETPELKPGEPFTLNLTIPNPAQASISKASIWLNYDPKVLTCESVTMGTMLPLISPGMEDCYPDEGLVKMEASAEEGSEPNNTLLKFASVILTPLDRSTATSSPLSFYGIGKETNIYTLKDGKESSILNPDDLSTLLINMLRDGDNSESEDSNDDNNESENDNSNNDNNSAGDNSDNNSPKENGTTCSKDKECVSGICEKNICIEGIENMPKVTNSEWLSITPTRLRVTSEGTAAMLAWDPLAVAGVKGYNLYYGETSGKYLHRRTIAAKDNTHIVRGLPLGRTVYFALRAVNANGDETGFSQEVSVTIGDPSTSTAPLVLNVGVTGKDPAPNNPIQPSGPLQGSLTQGGGQVVVAVPGETGLTSTMLWLILGGAIAGTLLALKRQIF